MCKPMNFKEECAVMKDGDEYKFYSNGKWKKSSSGNVIDIKNPYNKKFIGKIQACTKEEVDEVVESARRNLPCWMDVPLRERAEIIHKAADIIMENKDELGFIMMQEIGKPLKSAISEIVRTADIFHATAEAGVQMAGGESSMGDASRGFAKSKISLSYRVPLGVILCIGPFNYPFNLTGSKIAPALMAGNTVVMKSATSGAISPSYFGIILEKAGVPPGVFNFITGRGSEIGDYLVSHKGIDMIAFTGSTDTGLRIPKVAGLKTFLLELGGKDAAIVLDDADLEITSKAVVSGTFSYNGQRCTAVKRLLPMPGIADKLVEMVTEKTKKLTIGDPAENCDIGPLITSKQCDFVQSLIDDALDKGATLVMGNKREGDVMWPTILDNVTLDMRIAWEEPFGPILPIIRIKSIEEGIEISNKSEYGLQGMIFTENIDLALNIAQALDVGTVQINGKSSRGPDHFPFLGAKSSGMGTQGIKFAVESMSRIKGIVMNLSDNGKIFHSCGWD